MQRLRVLAGGHADVDAAALGIELQALVAVQLRNHGRSEVEAFQRHALNRREVLALYHVAGAVDFLVHVAVRGPAHLRQLAMDGFTARPEVARIETSLVFEVQRARQLPDYRADRFVGGAAAARPAQRKSAAQP